MKKLLLFIGILLFTVSISFTVTENANALQCKTNTDCEKGNLKGYTCVNGSCKAPNSSNTSSGTTAPATTCKTDANCSNGQKCVNGSCKATNSSNTSSGTTNNNTASTTVFQNPIPKIDSAGKLLQTIVNFLLGLTGIIEALVIVIAGIQYMTSAGNQDKVNAAKQTITTAVIGMVLALSAGIIINIIFGIFGI